MKRRKGIIFDMDNTLLQSHIDYAAMKRDTYELLVEQGMLASEMDLDRHTTSTLIQFAEESGKMTDSLSNQIWEIVKEHEVKGMEGADLEPGVTELLDQLNSNYILTVLTNNSVEAAEKALREQNIRDYFELVVGRETTQTLKPSPEGVLYIVNHFPDLSREDWVSLGDAWIDGLAATRAGVSFISYQTDLSVMYENGVEVEARISSFAELISLLQNEADS